MAEKIGFISVSGGKKVRLGMFASPSAQRGAVHSSSLVFLFVKLILTTKTRSIQINTMDGDAEYRERDRLWRQKKRESDPTARQKDRDYSQSYYEKNHEIINQRSSEYRKNKRIEHPEEVRARDREKRKRYVAMHQEEVMAKKQIKHLCECGGKYTSAHKSTHLRSKKHQAFCSNILS